MNRWRGGLFLVLLGITAAAVLSWVNEQTRARIEANEQHARLRALSAVLPDGGYDNDPHLDVTRVTDSDLLGAERPLPVYRARLGGAPVAAVVTAIAPNGFAGPIRLLVGIGIDGNVIGVRAAAHQETPGLGDGIDADKSDWIEQFNGLQTADPLAPDWLLDSDGGTFDRLTGATVTSNAVVGAVRNAVIYFNTHPDKIWAVDPRSPNPSASARPSSISQE